MSRRCRELNECLVRDLTDCLSNEEITQFENLIESGAASKNMIYGLLMLKLLCYHRRPDAP